MVATWNARLAKWPYFRGRIMPAMRDFGTVGSVGPIPRGLVTDSICEEFNAVLADLRERQRIKAKELRYPTNRAVGNATALFLYAWTRKHRPNLMVESGVANGYSTAIILKAMLRNRKGRLVSLEVSQNVGQLVTDIEMERWTRWLIRGGDKEDLRTSMAMIRRNWGAIDLFFHDSHHDYYWQTAEYETAYRSGARVIASDDVQDTFSFVHFAMRHNEEGHGVARFIFDDPKMFAIWPIIG